MDLDSLSFDTEYVVGKVLHKILHPGINTVLLEMAWVMVALLVHPNETQMPMLVMQVVHLVLLEVHKTLKLPLDMILSGMGIKGISMVVTWKVGALILWA